MCLAPSTCSQDTGFFYEGVTIRKFAKIQNQYLSTMFHGISLLEVVMPNITKSGY